MDYYAWMGLTLLTERHADQIAGVLSCYDRILIFGTLPNICFAEGMTSYLYAHKVRIFDYPRFAQPFREELRMNAERLAAENGITIEHIRKKNIRKEDLVQAVLAKRGSHPGLVAIFSAMEACPTYQPWHNKQTGKTYLKPDDGKCLHYYFYFIDEDLGLTYVRVPTWLPCRLQVYFNGHNWLAAQLRKRKIAYELLDNAFVEIGDWNEAQRMADDWKVKRIHKKLDEFAQRFCPIFRHFGVQYHWSLDQAEYATDIVFRREADLQPLYAQLTRTAIHADTAGTDKLNKISRAVEENGRSYRGFNFFDDDDQELFESLLRGEFNISGFQSRNLRYRLKGKTSGQISRLLKRLRVHGLIKKIGKTYKYYLTSLGKQVITLGLKLKQLHVIPQLSPTAVN